MLVSLVPLFAGACGTLEIGLELTPTSNHTPAREVEAPTTPSETTHQLEMTPTPVPEDFGPPSPGPAFTPVPVDSYPTPDGLRVAFIRDGNPPSAAVIAWLEKSP